MNFILTITSIISHALCIYVGYKMGCEQRKTDEYEESMDDQ